jgi:predicted Zn finger-like uncharacterized protein
MQFSCESCKANLQIADEKIRGKRLIVRCKRCGVQIRIVDPALAGAAVSTPPKVSPAPPAALRPSGGTSSGSAVPSPAQRRAWETENTRSMESEVLEKALRASRDEEPAPPSAAGPALPRSAPPPPPPEPPAPRDPAVWFAMVQGKQQGPITQAELLLEASAGRVGPRTYLWKEGMESWIRAKEVPDLVPLFAAPPAPPLPPREEAAAGQGPAPAGGTERPFQGGSRGAAPVQSAGKEPPSPDAPTPPGGTRIPEEAAPPAARKEAVADQPPADGARLSPGALDLARWGASELSKPRAQTPAALPKASPPQASGRSFQLGQTERRGPFRIVLAVVAAAAIGGLLALALLYQRRDRAAQPAPQEGPQAAQAPSAGGEPKPEEKPAAVPPSLSADDLKRKVDESKPILQGCVDEALQRDPALRVGKILISTTIAPSGAVTSARIDQKAVDQSPLGACLKSAAQRIQFPPFTGEALAVDIPVVVTGAP